MSEPRPHDDESDALRRLIEEGARVRPLDAHERRVLLDRLAQRLAPRARPRTRPWTLALAAAAVALLVVLASGALERRSQGASQRVAQQGRVPPAAQVDHSAAPDATSSSGPSRSTADTLATPRANDAEISIGGRAQIVLSADAVVRLPPQEVTSGPGPVEVALERGRLTASVAPRAPDEPLSIVTPDVVVTVVGTRFSVEVAAGVTTVAVEHGRVRVTRAGRALLVDAGESVRSDDGRLATPVGLRAARTPRSRPQASCSPTGPLEARRSCLADVARGRGLEAENALLALALLERDERADPEAALVRLREHRRRFPEGVLAREVALALVRTLVQSGRRDDACAFADEYAARMPDEAVTATRLRVSCAR